VYRSAVFPFVCVSVGSCGTRSDRVFQFASWESDRAGMLCVFRKGRGATDEVARFSAGSGWLVYACDEHGSPLAPTAPEDGSGSDVPADDAGVGAPPPHVVAGLPVVAADLRPGDTVTIEVVKGAGTCPRCDGCGRIANDVDGTPWSFWEALPPGSDGAVRAGIVQPVTCPDCGGKGSP